MIKFFGFLLFICNAGIVVGADREFGHPIFRTFTAHDYGELGEVFTVTEDSQGRMLFGRRNEIAAFDNSRWETIAAPGTGAIRSLAVDARGTVWFSSSTEIGYLSKIDGVFRVLKIAEGAFGVFSKIVTKGDDVYVGTQDSLLVWNNGHLSRLSWPTGSINATSLTLFHGKITAGDQSGSIYELEGGRFKQIVQSPSMDAGPVRAIVDCPIQDGFIVRRSGIFQKTGSTLVPWKSEIDSLLNSFEIYDAKWILDTYLAVLLQNGGVYLLDREGRLVESLTPDSGLEDAGFRAVGEDRDGGLSICSDTVITRIQCDAGCTEFDHQLGLPRGFINGVVRYQGKIYASTGHGVYVLFDGARVEALLDKQNHQIASADGAMCQWQGKIFFVGPGGVWQLRKGSDRLEPFKLPAESLRSKKIFELASSRLTDDYVWVVSRPPHASPEIGFEVGRLYTSGRYEPLSHLITYPLGDVYDIWEDNIDGEPVAWIGGDYGLIRVVLNQPTFNQRKFELFARQILSADGEILPAQEGERLMLKYDARDF